MPFQRVFEVYSTKGQTILCPPYQTNLTEIIKNHFSKTNINYAQRYILGDFNISLLSSQKDKCHQKNKKLSFYDIENIFSFGLYTALNDY